MPFCFDDKCYADNISLWVDVFPKKDIEGLSWHVETQYKDGTFHVVCMKDLSSDESCTTEILVDDAVNSYQEMLIQFAKRIDYLRELAGHI